MPTRAPCRALRETVRTVAPLLATLAVSGVAEAEPPGAAGGGYASGTIASTNPPGGDEPAQKTLISGKVDHGGYGAPELRFTSVLGGAAVLVGAQGGWIIDHRFVLGFAGYGLATRHDVPEQLQAGGQPSTLEMGYGGFRAMYVLWPDRVVHFDFALLVGGGGLVAQSKNEVPVTGSDGERDLTRPTAHEDAFFAMEPAVELELNVTTFMRAAVGASYRYIGGVTAPALRYSDLSAPAGGIALRFGSF